ncbi:MAG TPA: MFS transporter [Candidatus Bilamarchaeum sp.]|nr:MFS transporter [Candidatus Bilamarchaeum sp.]
MKKSPLPAILFTVFLDLLGFGIAIPVLAPLFLDPSSPVLSTGMELSSRTFLLGLLLASYPLAQFFGAPIIGGLSDHYGRKKLLLLSLAGTFAGYVLFAAGIMAGSLPLLFLGRIIDGFTGGNISIALSAIADISDPRAKSRNFGLVGMVFGLGFIVGPFVGGKLADPSVVSWFSYSTPFLFAALLSLLNILLVSLGFPETLTTRSKTPVDPLMGVRNIVRAFSMPNLRAIFLVVFLLTFGFNFFTQFFPVFLIEKFSFTQSTVGDTFAYVGFWVAITQGLINRKLSSRFAPDALLRYSILFTSIALALLVLPDNPVALFAVLTFVPMMNGMTYPNYTALISNLSGKESQGEVLGITQSVQSLAMAIPPIIAGFIVSTHIDLPIMVASLFTFLSWAAFLLFFRKQDKAQFHEI